MSYPLQHQGPDQLLQSESHIAWLPDQAVNLRADDEDIACNPPISVVTLFTEVVEKNPNRIAMVDNDDIYTYKRYYESVTQVAKAFIKLGLESHYGVGIIGHNSPHWFISYLGTIFAGGIAVGMFHSIRYIAYSTRCNILIVEDEAILQSILEIADDLPHLKVIIQYKGQPNAGSRKVYSWQEIMKMKVDDCQEELKRRIVSMAPNECCTIVATSGTTGSPKLTMLSHDNIVWSLKSLISFLNEREIVAPDSTVSYQNLSHVAALLMDVYWPLVCNGGTVRFAEKDALKKGSLTETLRKAKATFFCGIPKVFEILMNSYLNSEVGKTFINKKSISWAKKMIRKGTHESMSGNNRSIKFKFVKFLILKKIAARLGLDRCRFALVGASPCKSEVLEFFLALDIPLLECYGMSEGACISTNLRSNFNAGTVGQMLPGVRLKFQKISDVDSFDNAEVCLLGRNLFMGYLNDEQNTKKVFDEDEWYHTSDLGQLGNNGELIIAGRLNDCIQLEYRKIFPLPIEQRILDQMPCLSYCVAVGEGRDFLNVFLVFKTKVDPETGEPTDFLDQSALDWCRNLGISAKKLSEIVNSKDKRLADEIEKVIKTTNEQTRSDLDLIHKWKILPKPFSVSGGELGLTMKLKRNVINQLYREEISEFYK